MHSLHMHMYLIYCNLDRFLMILIKNPTCTVCFYVYIYWVCFLEFFCPWPWGRRASLHWDPNLHLFGPSWLDRNLWQVNMRLSPSALLHQPPPPRHLSVTTYYLAILYRKQARVKIFPLKMICHCIGKKNIDPFQTECADPYIIKLKQFHI